MAAPDQRIFRYQDRSGVIRDVKGYRGDGDALSRRGLPVCDASMLVNLTIPPPGGRLLDPFAGIGGIIIPAARRGLEVYSMDLDPALRHGLSAIAAGHAVADAGQMPIEGCSIDAVATEPPYHPEADESVERAMAEIARVLRPGARAAVLCAARQAGFLRASAANVGMIAGIDAELNRKGLDVTLLTWVKLDRPEL